MTELTLKQIQTLKKLTEQQITDLVMKFQEETGLNVTYLNMDTRYIKQMGDGYQMNMINVVMDAGIP